MAKFVLILMLAAMQFLSGTQRRVYLCIDSQGSLCCLHSEDASCDCCRHADYEVGGCCKARDCCASDEAVTESRLQGQTVFRFAEFCDCTHVLISSGGPILLGQAATAAFDDLQPAALMLDEIAENCSSPPVLPSTSLEWSAAIYRIAVDTTRSMRC